jgi:putative ABC transport system permease protein
MSVLTDLLERVRALFLRRREERELDEEMRFHLEREAEQHRRAGASEAEARRLAAIALGGVERTKEEVREARGTRLLEDILSDFNLTLRSLARRPGFATVTILTLAIGIGGTTAVYSAVDAVLLQPLPYRQPGQLVRLYQAYVNAPDARQFVTPVHFLDYRTRMSSFDGVAAILTYSETGADIGQGESARRIRLLPVSADYFDVLGVHPVIGHAFQRADEIGSAKVVQDIGPGASLVVLSRSLWEQHFGGDPGAVGKTIVMNGTSYTVAGVMPRGFVDPIAGGIDAWVPMDLRPGSDPDNVNNHYLTVLARLRPGTPIERAQAELDLLGGELARDYPRAQDIRARLYPLKQDVVGSSSRALEVLFGAVVLVLILACVNIANLLLVRGSERAHEFALRSALGARRARLVRQLLIESLTLAMVGGVAGLIVARLGIAAIVALGAGSISRLATLTFEPRLLAFSFAVAATSAVGFGLVPALRAARTDPGNALRDQSRSSTGSVAQMRLREWLVVSQVALAFVLLVGAGLLIASLQRLHRVNLGIQPAGALVFELHLPDARYDSTARARFYDAFAKQVEGLGGVVAAGGVSRLPATGSYHSWGVRALTGPLAGDPRRNDDDAEQRVIAGDYLKTLGIPLIEGRTFDARDDATAPFRVLVSRSVAERFFPGVDAVGQQLRTGGHDSEVIGVVGDVALDPEGTRAGHVYHWHSQWAGDRNWALVQVVRASGSLQSLEAATRRLLATLDPQLVMFKPMTLGDAVGQGEAQRAFTLYILAAFALGALALSALGLFGVLSYGVRARTREFGIRMALGAEAGAILLGVLRQGLGMTAIGTLVGLVGAAALSRLMSSLVFQVHPLEPGVLIGAALFMAGVAGVAAYLPARRATTVDPRTALQ